MPGGVLRPHDLPVLHDHLRVQGEPVAAGLLRWVGVAFEEIKKASLGFLVSYFLRSGLALVTGVHLSVFLSTT